MIRNILILLICIFSFEFSLAQEGSEVAPAEGAKEGEAAKPGPPKKEEVSTQQEVLELQARLQGLKTKIAAKKDGLKKLIEEKQFNKDEKQSLDTFNQMKSEYKDLQASIKEYDEQLSLLNYRYPEKGLNKERKYERIEVKSLDELERQFSLEGKIKKTMARVRQQFPNKKSNKGSKVVENDIPDSPAAKISDPSRKSVTEPLLLSK